MSLPQNETRNTTTKRQIIKDPGVEAAFPGVDDGTTPGDPFAPADVGGEKPAGKFVVIQIRKTSRVRN